MERSPPRLSHCMDARLMTLLAYSQFHELIITQELARIGARGYSDGLLGGMVIGLPPVMSECASSLWSSTDMLPRFVPQPIPRARADHVQ